jgi:cell division protein FtsZ
MERIIEEASKRLNKEREHIYNPADEELELLLSKQKAKIKVVGTGGAGNNTINRISEVGVTGAETIAVNTDAQDLLYTNADVKILIGKEITHGLGAGSIPQVGEEAARESEHELKSKLNGADIVFITCGLGGGTGTGSAPIIAEQAKKVNALTVGIVTLPFNMEGQRRY